MVFIGECEMIEIIIWLDDLLDNLDDFIQIYEYKFKGF
jgi:hypothetical protein